MAVTWRWSSHAVPDRDVGLSEGFYSAADCFSSRRFSSTRWHRTAEPAPSRSTGVAYTYPTATLATGVPYDAPVPGTPPDRATGTTPSSTPTGHQGVAAYGSACGTSADGRWSGGFTGRDLCAIDGMCVITRAVNWGGSCVA